MRKGTKMSAESRRKMSEAARRRPSNRLGKPHSAETRRRISEITKARAPRGETHYAWKGGGGTEEQRRHRKSPGYKSWRRHVKENAGGACECCGCERMRMHAHHIKPFASHPELRLAADNGAWLCDECHWFLHAG